MRTLLALLVVTVAFLCLPSLAPAQGCGSEGQAVQRPAQVRIWWPGKHLGWYPGKFFFRSVRRLRGC